MISHMIAVRATQHHSGLNFPRHRPRISSCGGFTILEVALAAGVMFLALCSSLVVVQQSMRSLDTARDTAIAGQILQSLCEDLRTRPWSTIAATTSVSNVALNQVDTSSNYMFTTEATILNRYKFSRTAAAVTNYNVSGVPTMEQITLTATWTGIDGRVHSVSTTMLYAQSGLYAYYSS